MTAITTAARLLRVAADELKNAHTLGGDWGNEHEALDAYNEHMATATTLEHMARQCLQQIEEPAGAAPAAVAPQGDKDDSLLLCASDLQHSAIYDSHSEMQDCARSVADRIKALAAPALEAPALEAPAAEAIAQAITNNFRDAGWSMPSIDSARVLEEVQSALGSAAAPQAPAAPSAKRASKPVATLEVLDNGCLEYETCEAGWLLPEGLHRLYSHPAAPAAPAVDALGERDAAFEAVRKRLCGLQRYSFVLDDDGVVRRAQDRTGNWIEFDDAHALFDPVAVDAARAAQAKEGGEA